MKHTILKSMCSTGASMQRTRVQSPSQRRPRRPSRAAPPCPWWHAEHCPWWRAEHWKSAYATPWTSSDAATRSTSTPEINRVVPSGETAPDCPNNAPAAPGVPPGPGGNGAGDPGRGLRRRGSRTEFWGNRHQNFAQARARSAAALCRRTGACGTSTTPPNDGKVPETAPCGGPGQNGKKLTPDTWFSVLQNQLRSQFRKLK